MELLISPILILNILVYSIIGQKNFQCRKLLNLKLQFQILLEEPTWFALQITQSDHKKLIINIKKRQIAFFFYLKFNQN
jgi:hypothetical protein